jgi:hypothetical protein
VAHELGGRNGVFCCAKIARLGGLFEQILREKISKSHILLAFLLGMPRAKKPVQSHKAAAAVLYKQRYNLTQKKLQQDKNYEERKPIDDGRGDDRRDVPWGTERSGSGSEQ